MYRAFVSSAPRFYALVLLVTLFLGLRLLQPGADPPLRYPSGRAARELIVEGAAKAHEARRYGRFGTFTTKSEDNYRIWSVQSPAYVMPLAAFFRGFGTGRVELRVFNAVAGALGLLALFALARRHAHSRVAPIACGLCLFSFHDIQLTRGALLEPYLNMMLLCAFLCGSLALQRLPWLVVAQVLFAAALLTKQTALFAAPVLLGLGIFAHAAAARRAVPRWQHALSVGSGLVLASALLAYMRSKEYWQTVEWNVGHMLVGVEDRRAVDVTAIRFQSVLNVLRRMFDGRRWHEILLYTVPLAPLALIQVGRTLRDAWRRRVVEPIDAIASGWLVCALLVLQLTEHVRPRFSIILLPASALLTASVLTHVCSQLKLRSTSRWLHNAPLVLAALVVLATDVRWQATALLEPHYELRNATRVLDQQLTADDVVIGSDAPYLAFDTRADLFYVKGPFNTRAEALSRLGVTHLLIDKNDGAAAQFRRVLPERHAARKEQAKLTVFDSQYTLYRVADSPVGKQVP